MTRVRTSGIAALAVLALAIPVRASATTTLVLDAPDSESADTFIRGGSYAGRNYNGSVLITRASDSSDNVRRALLKFDTSTRVPAGASIASARLTLTVRGGYSATRLLSVYRLSSSFSEGSATWTYRSSSSRWSTSGGDLGARYAQAYVYGPGSKVTFDVTRLVQNTVDGTFGSRYTRIVILDAGTSSYESYREFYSSEASTASVRPTLTVTYGGSSSTSDVSATSTSSTGTSGMTTLRVLQWNTHHGGTGTDGVYDPARLASYAASYRPDVISFNEVGDQSQADSLLYWVRKKTGNSAWTSRWDARGNMVLSRLSKTGSDDCLVNASAGRKSAHMAILVNGLPVNVWSSHLALDSSSVRTSEVDTLWSCERSWQEARIAMGDYNMQPYSTEYYASAANHVDGWLKAKSLGAAYNYSRNCDGCTRNSRIDYVWLSKGATTLSVKSAQIYDTRDANGVMPSDHKPLLLTLSVK